MAGGIDWFRWHHGSVSDQKFVLIARRSGASVAEVIAVWACLLEQASTASDRGCAGLPDFEAMDCALGMADGRAQAVYEAMLDRQMLNADGFIVSWEKRQPKRERDDDKSTERVRAFREKQRQETPGNATERAETPREEKSREESNTPPTPKGESDPAGFAEFWESWPSSERKSDRKKCAAKWRRCSYGDQLEAILAHVAASKETRKWREGFDPAPLTYLNGERWRDGVTLTPANPMAELMAGAI